MARLLLLSMILGVSLCASPPLSSTLEAQKILQDPYYASLHQPRRNIFKREAERATASDEVSITIDGFMGANDSVTITGVTMQTINGRDVSAFMGIRYGQPPIDDLRFKKTEPAGPYFSPDTTLDATQMGPSCPQSAGAGVMGEEDCLFVNVFTPHISLADPDVKLPVMVFIHGGFFTFGDATEYLPYSLLDKDVVLVAIQYRIGSLGFFSLQNDDAPGNAGLWDQIEALKWVQDNIDGFGGDNNKVTIFGQSAGSCSVNLLLVMPEASGLFHAVIGESGSAIEHWSIDVDPKTSANLIAQYNQCETTDETVIYECMKTKSIESLIAAQTALMIQDRLDGLMGFRGTTPVISGPEVTTPLLVKYPEQYYIDGEVNQVPLMIGANKHEGAFVLRIVYLYYLVPLELADDTEFLRNELLNTILNSYDMRDQTNGIGEAFKETYIGDRDLGDFNYSAPGLIDLNGVLFLKAGAWQTAKLHVKHTDKLTFFYSFDFESDLEPVYDDVPFITGVTHSDELYYLFPLTTNITGVDDIHLRTRDRLVTLWTNFAIHGHPTPADPSENWQDLGIPEWKPVTDVKHDYMLIETECTVQEEYPLRWHIALDDDEAARQPSTTTEDSVTTKTPEGGISQEDYDQAVQQRKAFMITMIIFIVAFVVAAGLGAFLVFKK